MTLYVYALCVLDYSFLMLAQMEKHYACAHIGVDHTHENTICFSLSDQIPYIESGDYVAYNNENGGVIESLKKDGIVDLDTEFYTVPEWISAKAMVSSWLEDALMYELWVGSDGMSAERIYHSDLPWPIGKVLFLKQLHFVKQQFGITKDNADQKEEEVSYSS